MNKCGPHVTVQSAVVQNGFFMQDTHEGQCTSFRKSLKWFIDL